MEVRTHNKDKGPFLAAVIALFVLGVGSVFLTWQNITRQRELVDQHLLLSAGAVVHGVDANIVRVMHSLGRSPDMQQRLLPALKEAFQEFTSSGEIVFLGIFDEAGRLVVSSSKDDSSERIALPEEIIAELEVQGRWAGPLVYHGKTALFAALRTRPSFARTCTNAVQGLPDLPPVMTPPEMRSQWRGGGQGRGRGFGFGMGPGMGRGMAPGMGPMMPFSSGVNLPPPPDAFPPTPARDPEIPSMFLVAALSPARHLTQFNEYRNAALLQTGYVLVAATVLWMLSLAYLNRRNQALKAARLERFQSKLLDNMPDGLLTLDGEGHILSANGSAARLLLPHTAQPGFGDATATPGEVVASGAELTGRSFRDFPFAEQAATDGTRPDEWRQYAHDGRILEVLCLPLQSGPGSVGEERLVLLRDRTRMKHLEEDLAEAKRLAAIGSLAAGVAHEIRNPLSALRGFAQLFATKLKGQHPLDSYACTMVQEADRLNRVVTDLLYLARPREIAPELIDLAQLGESLHGLLRFDLERKGITPAFNFRAPTLYADVDALRQAILNLVVNALDAVPDEGGTLTISSERDDSRAEGPDTGVWISVSDNGHGMDEAVRDQAFEPFFTAKRQGTGLGLAIVQGIARAHHGRALIDSTPGQGATVRLFFPDGPDVSGGTPNAQSSGGDA